jgi:MSHA biogenesis protein MshJ
VKAAWTRFATRYDALARRERALLMAASLVLIVGLGALLLIEPAIKQGKLLQQQITRSRADLAALQPQVADLQARQRDPDAATRAQLEALHHQLSLADNEFDQLQRALVSPQDMGRLLEVLLQQHRGLQLVGLRNVPVTSVSDLTPPAAAAAIQPASRKTPDAWLFRHGVEITVQGSYADMQAYLDALERLPRRVYWGELKIDAQKWPASQMTVTVYTISLEKTWWRV